MVDTDSYRLTSSCQACYTNGINSASNHCKFLVIQGGVNVSPSVSGTNLNGLPVGGDVNVSNLLHIDCHSAINVGPAGLGSVTAIMRQYKHDKRE